MHVNIKDIIVCPQCKGDTQLKEFSKSDNEVTEGVFTCDKCNSWYPVIEGVANFLPVHLTDPKRHATFQKKWKLKGSDKKEDDERIDDKLKQISFFKEDVECYDDEIEGSPFWGSEFRLCMKKWLAQCETNQLMLDLGCGTGSSSFPFAEKGLQVIGIDLSEDMVIEARKKAKELGLSNNSEFIVADAESLPFKDGTFDRAVAFGVLHHVPNPKIILKILGKMLKQGGLYFGHENNRSKLRFVFDIMMKISKQWHEEAGPHPLISEKEIKDWGLGADLLVEPETTVFLPPHLFNMLGDKKAEKLLSFTDNIFTKIPLWKHEGGALIINAKKV